jgi:diguanylate cyclase (GGDEF)-like protein
LLPVWVAPSHLVRTAKLIAEGDQLPIVTVLDNGEVLGYVTAEELALANEKDRVGSLVHPFSTVLEGQISIREASALVAKQGIPFAPVVKDNAFLGVITAHGLLSALLEEGDPLTGLRWSDHLREWGGDQLAAGREICVIAFDIPEFGHFNRRYGYNVGDRLLLAAVDAIQSQLNPETDVLVRHSGDELLVGTTREREHAAELARSLLGQAIQAIQDAGLGTIMLSYGFSGGYRTTHRESTHTAAMLDDLIRLAQRDGAEQRERNAPMATMEPAAVIDHFPSTPRILSVTQTSEPDPVVTVVVRLPEGAATGRSSLAHLGTGDAPLRDLSTAVANAIAHAIERGNANYRISIEDVSAFDQPDGGRLVSVFGSLETPVDTFALTGSARVVSGFAESVAEATLQAYLNLNLASAHS